MTYTLTTYYAYGVYVIRAKQEKWLECYFIGHQGADVLMESNMLVKMDERMQRLDKEVERYGCFETLGLQPHRLRFVRTITETEKDDWDKWHYLYRELKWKIKSIQPHQTAIVQECKNEFSHVQQLAEQLQKNYPVSPGERKALHSLLDDMYCMIAEFHLEEGTDKAQWLVKPIEAHASAPLNRHDAITLIEADDSNPENEGIDTCSTLLVQDTLSKHGLTENSHQETQLTYREEREDNGMKSENTVLMNPIQHTKEEYAPLLPNVYENKDVIEYFRRFYQLYNAITPLAHTEDATVQPLLMQLHIELAWIKTKILRSLGIHAVHSENKVGEMEFIRLKEGVYANTFQTLMLHSLFDNFGKAVKDSAAVFEIQKNVMIRMILELFRDEPTSFQTGTQEN